jgi:nucleotidyltransferase AbiEii toxin of type IV toxin-antitoxin system
MALDLIAELEALVDGLSRAGVEYALCGGLAVAVHGHPRATMDIDLLVPSDQLAAALEAAKRAGFDLPARKMVFGVRTGRPREVHRVSKLDPDTNELMSLDLIVVGPTLEETWRGRVVVPWLGRQVPIVSREGLVTMKRLAGRPQDLADIAALEGTSDDET